MADLVAQVKAIQKQEGGRDLWGVFIAQDGTGKRDPSMKEPYQLKAFLKQAASMGYSTQGGGGGKGGGGGGKKGGSWGGGGSFNGGGKGKGSYGKVPAMGGMMMGGGNMEGLQNNMTLVTRVKAAQKMEGGREAWIQFIDYKGGVNRDPARRTQDELEEFLATYDPNGESLAPALEMATAQMLPMMQMMMGMGGGGGGGGMGGMMSMMGGMGGGQGGGQKRKHGDGGGNSQYSPESGEHAQLIQRVKQIQKEAAGKEAWKVFVSASGVGRNDPGAHSCESLASFISEQDPTFDVTTVAVAGSNQSLVDQIKQGQKKSGEFKQAWIVYTDANGGGVRDPSKHDAAFIQPFLDSAPAYEGSDSNRFLVEQIKQGQRKSGEFKQAWIAYTNANGDGNRDPTKYDAAFIQPFLDSVDSFTSVASDEEHTALIEKIKNAQRASKEFKESWWTFCQLNGEGKNDPVKHDKLFLQTFLDQSEWRGGMPTGDGGPVSRAVKRRRQA